MDRARHTRRKARPTIGLIAALTSDRLTLHLWSGVNDVLQEQEANLIFIPAHALDAPIRFDAQANVLYDLVGAETVDGLVLWSAAMAAFAGAEAARLRCEQYRPLPMVSVALALEGIPSVLMDNRQGVRDVVTHLIQIHGCRRIAFVGPRDHPEAEERYGGYTDALQRHGIPVDPNLVAPGAFNVLGRASGAEAIRLLLDERDEKFEAVAAATDIIAVGAIEALQARGMRAPEDVAVVGFDDLPEAEAAAPPVTTVSFGAYRLGQQAAEILLAHMAGEKVPERLVLPMEIVVRQSCGCLAPEVVQAATESANAVGQGLEAALSARRESIVREMTETVGAHAVGLAPQWAEQLLDTLADALRGERTDVFLSTLDETLRRLPAAEFNTSAWQRALSVMRRNVQPCLAGDDAILPRAENLWQQARVMITNEAERAWMEGSLRTEQRTTTMREVGETLITSFDMTDLAKTLARELPRLGIPSAYLSLYEEPEKPAGWSRLAMAYNENGRIQLDTSRKRFPSCQLVPTGLLPHDRRYSLVIEPLYFRDEQLGFILLEAGPSQIDVCNTLRGQLSSALKGALLFKRSAELYQEALQARAAAEEADRLKTRFLASVSHELRTPLSLIMGLTEILLGEHPQRESPPSEQSRQDLERIHASAQHLDGLIGDVMDLAQSEAGQLRLVREPLDLVEVLKAVAAVGERMARGKGLVWKDEIPERLPRVWGDRARLRQVALNLVSNAVKFTAQGEVVLRAKVQSPIVNRLSQVADGDTRYTMSDQQVIAISVSDTGLGIPPEEQNVIFDEFHQSERTTARGYGGLGLGLAICRRLVEMHGGTIGVRSPGEEGGGSTFFFTLPLAQSITSIEGISQLRGQTVLLLAERAGDGEQLREHLTRQGFGVEVEEYHVGEKADWLSKVLASPPGAVVLDTGLASEQGWEILRVLKGNPATQDVPVLFYALEQEGNGGAALTLDYLTKPVGTAELARALERQGLLVRKEQERRQTILVVDDEPGVLEMHARVIQLQLPHCRVLKARDGQEALEAIRQEHPDMVLLDLMMPGLDGFGVLEAMQQEKPTRDVPVVVLTGQVLTERDMKRLNRGVAAVLGKGLFSTEETLAHIEQALARSKRLGSETQQVVRKAMAYIHEHYTEPVSRQDIAWHVDVSKRHLDRCFRQEVGMTPITYLNRYRVKQARILLEKGSRKITEVALEVGFTDGSNFARAFRREVGLSPSAYRQTKRAS